jgi:electron-transferring-flavoprotein dehydrogenase
MSEHEREEMEVDVLFVGAGIANLTAAYKLMKNVEAHNASAAENGKDPIEEPAILVIDKSHEPGSHVLSGAVVDPTAFKELFPEMDESEYPFATPVKKDNVHFLTKSGSIPVPHFGLPKEMQNSGGYYLSSQCSATQWMIEKCEEVGIEVFPGEAVTELIKDGDKIVGAKTGNKGIGPDGEPTPAFAPGMDLLAKVTVLGEGTYGYLSQQLIKEYHLDAESNPQVWALGMKELIKIPEGRVEKGSVIHTFGYPLEMDTYGGSFVYAYEDNLVGVGLVIALDYPNPQLSVHDTFLQFKKHPVIAKIIEGGEVEEYGAKTLPEGGYYAIPKLSVAGAVLVGDSAGMLNAMRLKGIHLAMKSGMLAADKICAALAADSFTAADLDYRTAFDESWAGKEMFRSRNFRQGFHGGLVPGMMSTGLHMVSGGKVPGGRKTLPPDYERMKKMPAGKATPKTKTDQTLYLDIMGDVFKSGTMHREDEPSHLKFKDESLIQKDYEEYGASSTRFCPAEVYEKKEDGDGKFDGIQINFSNCLHCKTCEIKDPLQNILWTLPEGSEGPRYRRM